MTQLQIELKRFLLGKGVTAYFYPPIRGSKIVEFLVLGSEQRGIMADLLGHTFSNNKHKLTFSSTRNGGYACNFQPL